MRTQPRILKLCMDTGVQQRQAGPGCGNAVVIIAIPSLAWLEASPGWGISVTGQPPPLTEGNTEN